MRHAACRCSQDATSIDGNHIESRMLWSVQSERIPHMSSHRPHEYGWTDAQALEQLPADNKQHDQQVQAAGGLGWFCLESSALVVCSDLKLQSVAYPTEPTFVADLRRAKEDY